MSDNFQDLPGFIIRRMQQAAVSVFLARMAEAGEDLTPVQYAALNAVRQAPGIGQAELAGRIACDRSTTGSVIDRLEKKGTLRRMQSKTDRRARELYLTEAGEDVLAKIAPIIDAIQMEILSGLECDEVSELKRLLRKASDALDGLNRVQISELPSRD